MNLLAFALATTVSSTVTIELPRIPPAAGATLFARALLDDGTMIESASAELDGQRFPLAVEDSRSISVVLPIAPDAAGRLRLVVAVSGGDGTTASAEAWIDLVPATPAKPSRWTPLGSDLAKATAAAARRESARIDEVLATASYPFHLWRDSFTSPVRAPTMARFGDRRELEDGHVGGHEAPLHLGVDYPLRAGASIRAAADGIVLAVEELPLLGPTLFIDHGMGVVSLYAHLEPLPLLVGDGIAANAQLGFASDAGLTDRVMLHHAIFVAGRAVDPTTWQSLPAWLRQPVEPSLLPPPRTVRRTPPATDAMTWEAARTTADQPRETALTQPDPSGPLHPPENRADRAAVRQRASNARPPVQPQLADPLVPLLAPSAPRLPLEYGDAGGELTGSALIEALRSELGRRLPGVGLTVALGGTTQAKLTVDNSEEAGEQSGDAVEAGADMPELDVTMPDVTVRLQDRAGRRLSSVAQTIMLLVGELVGPVSSEVARLTIVDQRSGESMPILLRDAHSFWSSQHAAPMRQ